MKYLLIGAEGQLGKQFQKFFRTNNCDFMPVDIKDMDITDIRSVQNTLESYKPNVVINCAAYNFVEEAEKDPAPAFKVNSEGVKNLATSCKKIGCFLIHYSTNHVFDGQKDSPYSENDRVNPINQYGKSKLLGEVAVKEELPNNALIIRTSWLYGEGEQNFIRKFLNRVSEGKDLIGVTDEIATPTSTRLLTEVTMKAISKNLIGTYHIVNTGSASRWDWANEILKKINSDNELKPVKFEVFNLTAKLPPYAVLSNEKISKDLDIQIPDWKNELSDFIDTQDYFTLKI